MRRRSPWTPLLVAVVPLVAWAGAPAAPSPKGPWLHMQSPNFTFFSGASESVTREIALDLEKFRVVLSALTKPADLNSQVPTFVYVFRTDSAMEPYKPRVGGKPQQNVVGFFKSARDGNYITIQARWNSQPETVIYHEYVHSVLNANFPAGPAWFDEGLAEYYSTFKASGKEARVGLPVDRHVDLLRHEILMPLEKLLAVTHASPEYNESRMAGLFYAQSWALVHFLLHGEQPREKELRRYLTLVRSGADRDAAVREAFGMEPGVLLERLRQHVNGRRFHYARVTLSADLPAFKEIVSAPMKEEDVLLRLGDLLAHGQKEGLDDAEAHFQAVLSKNPDHAASLAGIALVRLRRGDEAGALGLYRKAAVLGPQDSTIHTALGWLVLHSIAGKRYRLGALPPDMRAAVDEARSAFRRSLELDLTSGVAHAGLGTTYVFEAGTDSAPGIPELEDARKRLPSNKDVARNLAILYDRAGSSEKADLLLRSALGDEAAPMLSELARVRAFRESDALLKEGKRDEAIVVLERAVEVCKGRDKEFLQRRLERLRKGARPEPDTSDQP